MFSKGNDVEQLIDKTVPQKMLRKRRNKLNKIKLRLFRLKKRRSKKMKLLWLSQRSQ